MAYRRRRRYRPYYRLSRGQSPYDILVALIGLIVVLVALQTNAFSSSNLKTLAAAGIAIPLTLLGIAIAIAGIIAWRTREKDRAYQVADIDRMDGIRFETYLKSLLSSQGFTKLQVTAAAGDYGADLLATRDGLRYVIQAKRYGPTNKVPIDAIYQVIGGKQYYGCDAAMVVTNSFYTYQAKQMAAKAEVVLIDRNTLKDWVFQFSRAKG